MAVKRGAAIVQIAVTNPVVIKTTRTQPGTSPRSSFNRAKNESCVLINMLRNWSSDRTARCAIEFTFPPVNLYMGDFYLVILFSIKEFWLALLLLLDTYSEDVDK